MSDGEFEDAIALGGMPVDILRGQTGETLIRDVHGAVHVATLTDCNYLNDMSEEDAAAYCLERGWA